MDRATPSSGVRGHLRVAPDCDEEGAVPGLQSHYIEWSDVIEPGHSYGLT